MVQNLGCKGFLITLGAWTEQEHPHKHSDEARSRICSWIKETVRSWILSSSEKSRCCPREAGREFGQWGTVLVRTGYVLLQDTQSLWINTVTGHFPLLSGSNIDQAILFQAVTQEPRLHPSHVLVILWWLQALPDIIQPAEGWGRWSLWTRTPTQEAPTETGTWARCPVPTSGGIEELTGCITSSMCIHVPSIQAYKSLNKLFIKCYENLNCPLTHFKAKMS